VLCVLNEVVYKELQNIRTTMCGSWKYDTMSKWWGLYPWGSRECLKKTSCIPVLLPTRHHFEG
jgi:hypothetical protein